MFAKVKQSLRQSPEAARRPAVIVSIVIYLCSPEVATYRSANAISAKYCKFSLSLSYLAPSIGVTPFEFMEKLY